MSMLSIQKKTIGRLALLGTALNLLSCNDQPLVPLDQSLKSSSKQAITLGAKTKIDILFVIDESQSMSDEQLAKRGLKREDIARHVFRDLFYM